MVNAAIEGIVRNPKTPFDEAWRLYLEQLRLGDGGAVYDLGQRFPEQVIEYREKLPAELDASLRQNALLRLEYAAMDAASLDLLNAVLVGKVEMLAHDREWTLEMVAGRLVAAFPEEARRRQASPGKESEVRRLSEAIADAFARQAEHTICD